jgi:hypothetical protein
VRASDERRARATDWHVGNYFWSYRGHDNQRGTVRCHCHRRHAFHYPYHWSGRIHCILWHRNPMCSRRCDFDSRRGMRRGWRWRRWMRGRFRNAWHLLLPGRRRVRGSSSLSDTPVCTGRSSSDRYRCRRRWKRWRYRRQRWEFRRPRERRDSGIGWRREQRFRHDIRNLMQLSRRPWRWRRNIRLCGRDLWRILGGPGRSARTERFDERSTDGIRLHAGVCARSDNH